MPWCEGDVAWSPGPVGYLPGRRAVCTGAPDLNCLLEKNAAMKPFKQMLGYIWPQWPRIIVVVFCALVIAVLLSLSFVTIIPLLKVMMGEEGLHGWVDRKTTESVYGLQFYLPEAVELTAEAEPSLKTHLRVVAVAEGSLAEKAGIRRSDHIADVNNLQVRENADALYTQLLHELATARGSLIPLKLTRQKGEIFETLSIELATPDNEQYIQSLGWSAMKRFRWQAQVAVTRVGQRIVSFLPANDKVKAILIIMGAVTVITLIRCAAKFYQDYLGQKIVEVGINQLREDVFGHMTHMPIGLFAAERPSDLISRIVRDTVIMGGAMRVLLGKALREPMNALIMLITALFLNWQLSLVFLCGAPFVAVLLGSFGRKMKKATRHSLVASSQMLAKLQETVTGLRVVKVYNQQEYEQHLFRSINDRLLKQLLKISKVDAATHPVLEVLGMVAGTGALVVGMVWVTKGQLDGPEFLLLLVLLGAAAEAVRKTSDSVHEDPAGQRRGRANLRNPRAAA